MKLKTNKLLLSSSIIISLTFLAGTFWRTIGFGDNETPILAFAIIVAFGMNIAGFILAFTERKMDRKKSIIGLIGNLVLIIAVFAIMIYALTTMN